MATQAPSRKQTTRRTAPAAPVGRPGEKAPTPRPIDPDEQQDEDEVILVTSSIPPRRPKAFIQTPDDPEGSHYEIVLLSEFGVEEIQSLLRDQDEYNELFEKSGLNNRQRKRLKQLLDGIFDRVLIAGPEVKNACNDFVRQQVASSFFDAPLLIAQKRAERQAAQVMEQEDDDSESSTTES